ncbi:MAG TPA: hypothetical protein VFZ83_16010 [Acidimicrobiia bacterium]|nr:hypothetical protein [Acidimicrobiia bacterium]
MTWLDDLTNAVAADAGLDASAYALTEEDATVLLELAGTAAHASGARTNAPLLCHVLGMMRRDGAPLSALALAVRAHAAGAGGSPPS